jgi:hypothetical protein
MSRFSKKLVFWCCALAVASSILINPALAAGKADLEPRSTGFETQTATRAIDEPISFKGFNPPPLGILCKTSTIMEQDYLKLFQVTAIRWKPSDKGQTFLELTTFRK